MTEIDPDDEAPLTFRNWGVGLVQFERAAAWFEKGTAIPVIVKTAFLDGEEQFILVASHANGQIYDILKKYRVDHMSWKNCNRAIQMVQEIVGSDLIIVWTGDADSLSATMASIRSAMAK